MRNLSLKWTPVPRKPWKLIQDDGRVFKSFDSVEAAQKWLEKNGYSIDQTKLTPNRSA